MPPAPPSLPASQLGLGLIPTPATKESPSYLPALGMVCTPASVAPRLALHLPPPPSKPRDGGGQATRGQATLGNRDQALGEGLSLGPVGPVGNGTFTVKRGCLQALAAHRAEPALVKPPGAEAVGCRDLQGRASLSLCLSGLHLTPGSCLLLQRLLKPPPGPPSRRQSGHKDCEPWLPFHEMERGQVLTLTMSLFQSFSCHVHSRRENGQKDGS